jgi:hypothetical protein
MGLSEHASTPAVVWAGVGGGVQTATTATFSPPAGSLVVVGTTMTGGTVFQTTPTTNCHDSNGTNYSAGTQEESSGIAVAQFFWHYYSSAPGAISVTFHQTAANVNQAIMVAARVVMGANASAPIGGVSSARSVPTNYNFNWATNPTTIGSFIYIAVSYLLSTSGVSVYDSNTQTIYNGEGGGSSGDDNTAFGLSGFFTSSLTPITMGWTANPASGATGFAGTNLEIIPGTTPVTITLAAGRVNVGAPKPTVIMGAGAALTTGRVNVAAPPPTVTASRITSGGTGATGNIRITYISADTQALASSISPIATTDPYGNAVPIGYQGPVNAITPGSQPSTVETWHGPLSLTNASASGNGVNGFWYRYRSDNTVELVWDILLGATASNICTLPSGYIPTVPQNVMTSWYGTGPAAYSTTFSPHLLISATGVISVQNCNSLTISLCGREKITLDGSL